jgi:hypothetical protein
MTWRAAFAFSKRVKNFRNNAPLMQDAQPGPVSPFAACFG